jgi:type VI secretion system protein VasG
MTDISRKNLFTRLSPLAYRALESATVFCKLRGNPYIEISHWIHQLVQLADSDLHRILREYEVEPSHFAADVVRSLDLLPRGATSISDISTYVDESIERGWVFGSLRYEAARIRTGHVVVGWLRSDSLRRHVRAISGQFDKIKVDDLTERLLEICAGSPEEPTAAGAAAAAEAGGAMAPPQFGRQEAVERFTVDLTARARTGEMDPIVGRDDEIRQIIDILLRRRQNNPILTGEAGVGKTAVVEGLAQRIVRGDVPPSLRGVALRALDVGLLQAGASMRGEFESRLRQLIDEVQGSPKPIILFIDEAHTLVGAGGAAGTGDAANLLKPALARGTLRTIAATTWAEYKRHIEKDPALTRRFQVVKVDEPSESRAVLMMRGIAPLLERHHGVQVLDEAIDAAVALSHRYIPARQLPDKSVSLLDTACARVAVSQHALPPRIEDTQRRIEALRLELEIADREEAIGLDVDERRTRARQLLAATEDELKGLSSRWERERALVERILALRSGLRGDGKEAAADGPKTVPDAGGRSERLAELRQAQDELAALQGEAPLILSAVDAQAVASVVADWTGIPLGRMVRDEVQTVLDLPSHLERRVLGQRHAMEAIARRIQTARARLDNPQKPAGVFLLCGPSGVGKTETAFALAEMLYGGEQNLITINMSEFQEAHTVSTLKGAPPGYVGYGEGGVLTEAVRRRPHSVVLLDEVEKAHPDVHEVFFQVFDKGVMEDGEGRSIDFRNTLILLTSNVGSDLVMQLCSEPDLTPASDAVAEALRKPLLERFPAALLGRLTVVPYLPLSAATLDAIITLQLSRIRARIEHEHGIPFDHAPAVVDLIRRRCTALESGARMVDAILTQSVLPALSRKFLVRNLEGRRPARVRLEVRDGDFAFQID